MPACYLKVVATPLFACALLGAACESSIRPTPSATNQAATVGMLGPSQPRLFAEAAGLSPQELAARGWTCRPVPSNPALTQCVSPNQGFPVVPPPDDRPPTYTVFLWDGATFVGQVLLIRPDLYQGQICPSTGQPYRFIALAGYYECTHRVGGQ
jgi:hypothetical protein